MVSGVVRYILRGLVVSGMRLVVVPNAHALRSHRLYIECAILFHVFVGQGCQARILFVEANAVELSVPICFLVFVTS